MKDVRDRELVQQLLLEGGGRLLIEVDEDTTYIAWPTPGGGHGETTLGKLSHNEIATILSVFREEGTELTGRSQSDVYERLRAALAPEDVFLGRVQERTVTDTRRR